MAYRHGLLASLAAAAAAALLLASCSCAQAVFPPLAGYMSQSQAATAARQLAVLVSPLIFVVGKAGGRVRAGACVGGGTIQPCASQPDRHAGHLRAGRWGWGLQQALACSW